jgi:hypothetical protein
MNIKTHRGIEISTSGHLKEHDYIIRDEQIK